MSSNRKNKKNNKKMNHHVLNSYTMEALEPRLMMAADLGAAFNELSELENFSTQVNSSIESLSSSLDQNISDYTGDLIDFTHSGYEKLSSFFSEVTEGAQTEAQNLSSAIQNRLDDISTQLSLRAELFSGEYCGDINAILALNVFGIYLKSAFFDV